jgi:hypothetical protein
MQRDIVTTPLLYQHFAQWQKPRMGSQDQIAPLIAKGSIRVTLLEAKNDWESDSGKSAEFIARARSIYGYLGASWPRPIPPVIAAFDANQ